MSLINDGDETVELTSDRRTVPDELKPEKMWALWDLEQKFPLAPWHTNHCYPAYWEGDLDESDRPETTYETAWMYADLPTDELNRIASFPRTTKDDDPIEDPIPEQVEPTILLPPDGAGSDRASRLMYIDFDDVRDPETEEVSAEVAGLIEQLDSYTELSSSETGVHVLVYASLPDAVGAIDGEPLGDVGSIEIYDHGRFFGGTWRHVADTPTVINERQDTVDEIIETYAAHRVEQAEANAVIEAAFGQSNGDGDPTFSFPDGGGSGSCGSSGSGAHGECPYFDAPLTDFADPAPMPKVRTSSGTRQGAHPTHGKTTDGKTSFNYSLDTKKNRWHCFADNSGGGPMEMAAIKAGVIECEDAGAGTYAQLDDTDILYTCVYARERLAGFTEDMDPPYRALVALARHYDLPMQDAASGVLGTVAHGYARDLYDELTLADAAEIHG